MHLIGDGGAIVHRHQRAQQLQRHRLHRAAAGGRLQRVARQEFDQRRAHAAQLGGGAAVDLALQRVQLAGIHACRAAAGEQGRSESWMNAFAGNGKRGKGGGTSCCGSCSSSPPPSAPPPESPAPRPIEAGRRQGQCAAARPPGPRPSSKLSSTRGGASARVEPLQNCSSGNVGWGWGGASVSCQGGVRGATCRSLGRQWAASCQLRG